MKTVAIVQARYASTRLPGKVLKSLPYGSDETVLGQVIKRLKHSEVLDDVVVATTDQSEDDAIAELCAENGWSYFRGSSDDVLSRYYGAAVESAADVVVRVTSDCPCIDVEIIDNMIEDFEGVDYLSNVHPRIYPHGLDAEIFTFAALEKAHYTATEKHDREHVTPFIINGDFSNKNYMAPVCGGSEIRITLDCAEDYTALCAVYDNLYMENEFFGFSDIIRLYKSKPWIGNINENIVQKRKYNDLNDEIDEALRILRLQELHRAAEKLEKYI